MPSPRLFIIVFLLSLISPFGARVSAESLLSIPESERGLERLVMGLGPETGAYFALPTLSHRSGTEAWEIERQLYWLDIELTHGRSLRFFPKESQVFVGVPKPTVDSRGREEEFFKSYLLVRGGWTPKRISQQVHFFRVPETLVWPQDACFVRGYDEDRRLVLASAPDTRLSYRGFAAALAAEYPQDFVIHQLSPLISDEGGDLALVRRPDGKPGLVVGRHRILNYLEVTGRGDFQGKVVPASRLKEAIEAYEIAYGLPVQVLPLAPLVQAWGDPEVFHLDMVAAFYATEGGATAAVPNWVQGGRDCFRGEAFEPWQTRAWAREFDQVARELKAAGYQVLRVPLADHPVRSPVNVLKFTEAKNLRLLVPRFPDQSPGVGVNAAGQLYALALERLRAAGEAYQNQPDPGTIQGMMNSLSDVWRALDTIHALPNPVAKAALKRYRSLSPNVQLVPVTPWGSGSLHCLWLH